MDHNQQAVPTSKLLAAEVLHYLKQDITILEALREVARLTRNSKLRNALNSVNESIHQNGYNPEVPMEEHPDVFSPLLLQIMKLGSQTGLWRELLEEYLQPPPPLRF